MADQQLQWVDASGSVTNIRGGGDIAVAEDVTGRFSPTMVFITERVPQQAGQRFRDVLHGLAEVKVPVVFYPTSATALRTTLRAWALRLDPTRGDGKLRVTAPGGDQRELVCRYSEGLERLAEDDWTDLRHRARAVFTFIAEQPYWQDVSDTITSWTLGTPATFFPFFPLRLSASEIFADATVGNNGDVESWPVWTITGPGSSLILRNLTTGKLLSLTATLSASETVTIDTRPGAWAVTRNDGSSLFSSLSSDSSLWSLARGSNSIRIELTGATAATVAQLNRRQRYLTA